MKSAFLLLLLFAAIPALKAQEQYVTSSNKFTLEMPEEWQRKSKLVMYITDILTAHVNEFEDRQFCIKCFADYKVRFQIVHYRLVNKGFEKVSNNKFQGETAFTFRGSMLVFNKDDKPIVNLVLIDTFAVQRLHYNFVAQEKRDNFNINSHQAAKDFIDKSELDASGETPEDIVRKHPPPSFAEFLQVFESRIKYLAQGIRRL